MLDAGPVSLSVFSYQHTCTPPSHYWAGRETPLRHPLPLKPLDSFPTPQLRAKHDARQWGFADSFGFTPKGNHLLPVAVSVPTIHAFDCVPLALADVSRASSRTHAHFLSSTLQRQR